MSVSMPILYSAPDGSPTCPDYEVKIEHQSVFVHGARVSDIVENQPWPGYQRPIEQTKLSGFCHFDTGRGVQVQVRCLAVAPKHVRIHPESYGIAAEIDGDTIRFCMKPGQFVVVEINDWHYTLHLFANRPDSDPVDPEDPNVLYFGPGLHDAGEIRMMSGQTLYLHGEAIVYGHVYTIGQSNLRICGRGILDSSKFERTTTGAEEGDPLRPGIAFFDCDNVTIEGIVVRDPAAWSVVTMDCADVVIQAIKIVGLWRYNTDGIDLLSSRNVQVRDCFIRSFDDSIAVKSLPRGYGYESKQLPVSDICAERCVIWNDWGKGLEIGVECVTPSMRGIRFRDCDIVHYVHFAFSVSNGNEAHIEDVLFEDIRITSSDNGFYFLTMLVNSTNWAPGDQRGQIRDVTFRRIRTDLHAPSLLQGYSDEHNISGVRLIDVRMDGDIMVNAEQARFEIGSFVEGVTFAREGDE